MSENAYRLEVWHDLFAFWGGTSVALMGLVFVGLSLHLRPIIRRLDLRGRARAGIGTLFSGMQISAFSLIPGQPAWVFGGELVIWSLFILGYTLLQLRQIVRLSVLNFSAKLTLCLGALGHTALFCGGVSIALRIGGGLYWVAVASLVLLSCAVLASWQLLVAVGEEEARESAVEPLPTPE